MRAAVSKKAKKKHPQPFISHIKVGWYRHAHLLQKIRCPPHRYIEVLAPRLPTKCFHKVLLCCYTTSPVALSNMYNLLKEVELCRCSVNAFNRRERKTCRRWLDIPKPVSKQCIQQWQ